MAITYRVEAGDKSAVLGATEFVIGRSLYCTLVIDDPSASRLHASLRRLPDGCEILDLGSSNGTFVNGIRVGDKPVRVCPADHIRIGNITIRLINAPDETRERMQTRPHPLLSPDDQPTGSYKEGIPGVVPKPGGSGE